jgi:hypothetical protein
VIDRKLHVDRDLEVQTEVIMQDMNPEKLLVAGLNNRAPLLFELDKLMSELVATGSETNKYITMEPLNAFHRKLVHIMVL